MLLGPLPGILAHRVASGQERRAALRQFDDYLTERAFAVREKLVAIVGAVHSVKALFESSDEVTREEFSTFTRDMLARYPEVLGAEWIPRVPNSERQMHEMAARSLGLSSYEIKEQLPNGHMGRASERVEYFPVLFVEPYEGNECAFGFDVGSESTRRDALERAWHSREVAISDPVVLVQEAGSSLGILAFLPVTDGAGTPTTMPGRRRDLVGLALLVFRIEDLARQLVPASSGAEPTSMPFRLLDTDVRGSTLVLHRSPGFSDHPPLEGGLSSRQLEVGGQRWLFEAYPSKGLLASNNGNQPILLAIAAFLGWELVFGTILALAIQARSLACRKQADFVSSVLGSLSEGVVVADKDGAIRHANEAAEEMVGMQGDGVPPSDWSSVYGCYREDAVTPYPAGELPLARAIRGERVLDEEIFIRNPSVPTGRWLSVSGTPLCDERGAVQGGVVVLRDITNSRESQEFVRRLSNAVEQTADMIFITARDGTIEYVNPAFEETLGYSKEEVLGRTPRILKSGEHDREHYRRLWETILAGNVHRATAVNRKKNGDLIHAEQTITPMKDSHGRVTHFVSVCKDMTEKRRRAEQDSELRLARIIRERAA
ncbi:MAG: CHASE domain-containing protein [Planctomycetota bacterium]